MTASFYGDSGIPPDDGPYAVKASNVSIIPAIPSIIAGTVQDALSELQGDIDLINDALAGLGGPYQPLNATLTDLSGRTFTAFSYTLLDDANQATAQATLGLVPGTNVQAYSANVASLAGLTLAANKGLSSTGANTLTTFDLTTFGRSLVDDPDAATARSTLGVAIGSDVQAYNINLASLAGLSVVGDRLVYGSTTNTLALAPFTAYARTLMDDADATTARGTLGLGTAATQNTGTSGGNVPLLSGANSWSAQQTMNGVLAISSTNPVFYLSDTNAGTDEKNWRFNVDGQFWELQTLTDAFGTPDTFMFFQRTAGVVTAIQINKATQLNASFTLTSSLNISSALPVLNLYENDVGTDLKRWQYLTNGSAHSLRLRNDADSAGVEVYSIARSTHVSAAVTFPSTTTVTFDGPVSIKDTLNTQSGTTYTIQASDNGKIVEVGNASAITVTVPNSLPVGFNCIIAQTGAGQATVAAGSGATLVGFGGLKTPGQWAEVALRVRANSGGSAAEAVLSGGVA